MKNLIQGVLRSFGWEMRRVRMPQDPLPTVFSDLTASERDIIRAVQPFTMTSQDRIANVILAVKYVVEQRVAGDIVECGVWRGGCIMAAALTLRSLGDTSRRLFLYDTFEGMSEPTAQDRTFDGRRAVEVREQETGGTGIWCYASLEDVRQNLLSTGYPLDHIEFVRGKVEETIPQTLPAQVALLRLDTDWYESTRHELQHLYPLLARWGVMIVDDYGYWQGSRRAVDEYLAGLHHPSYLHRIDNTGRMMIKVEA